MPKRLAKARSKEQIFGDSLRRANLRPRFCAAQVLAVTTFCRLGLRLGDAWVTLGSRKGHPSATQGRPKGRLA
jgi:hypothetical protein